MSIRKFRDSWWVDFRHNRTRFRKRSPDNSRAGAAVYEALLRQKLARGESIDVSAGKKERIPFRAFSTEWLSTNAKNNNKPSTLRAKKSLLQHHLIPFFGQRSLDEISSSTIEQFKAAKQKANLSAKTINNLLTVLHSCLESARTVGKIMAVPEIRWLKVPPQEFDYLSSEETQTLLRVKIEQPWQDMILCALHTGMRLGELCGLQWSDIDLKEKRLIVQHSLVDGVFGSPKNNRIRYIPLSPDLNKALSLHQEKRGLVFKLDGHPINSPTAWRGLNKACKAARLRGGGWHALRHTFASTLVARGVPIRSVQILLGHCSVQMTERYSHLAPSILHEAIALLETPTIVQITNLGQQVGNGVSRNAYLSP